MRKKCHVANSCKKQDKEYQDISRRPLSPQARVRLREQILNRFGGLGAFATFAGLNRSTLYRLLTGEESANPQSLNKIANALECKPSDIETGRYPEQRLVGPNQFIDAILGGCRPTELQLVLRDGGEDELSSRRPDELIGAAQILVKYAEADQRIGLGVSAFRYHRFIAKMYRAAKIAAEEFRSLRLAFQVLRPIKLFSEFRPTTTRIRELLNSRAALPESEVAKMGSEFGIYRFDNGRRQGLRPLFEAVLKKLKNHSPLAIWDIFFCERRRAHAIGHSNFPYAYDCLISLAQQAKCEGTKESCSKEGCSSSLQSASWLAFEHKKWAAARNIHEKFKDDICYGSRWPQTYFKSTRAHFAELDGDLDTAIHLREQVTKDGFIFQLAPPRALFDYEYKLFYPILPKGNEIVCTYGPVTRRTANDELIIPHDEYKTTMDPICRRLGVSIS